MKTTKSLYSYKPRPFKNQNAAALSEDSSKVSSSEIIHTVLKNSKRKRTESNILLKRSSSGTGRNIAGLCDDDIIEIDDDNEDLIRDEAKKKAAKLLEDCKIDVPIPDEMPVKPDIALEKAMKLFQSCKKISFDLNKLDAINKTVSSALPPVKSSINDFSLSIPIVLTAAERLSIARTAAANSLKSSSDLFDISEESVSKKVVENSTKLSIKTRMNGVHERVWRFSATETFASITKQISEVYGVPVEEISLVFDGEVLDTQDTPTDCSMETDDLIDVKIPKNKLDGALTAEKEFTAKSLSAAKSAPSKPPPTSNTSSHTGSAAISSSYGGSSSSKQPGQATPAGMPNAGAVGKTADNTLGITVYIPKAVLATAEDVSEDFVQCSVKVSNTTYLEKVFGHITKSFQLDVSMCYLAMDDDEEEIALPLDETMTELGIVDCSTMTLHHRISVTLSIQPGVERSMGGASGGSTAATELKLLATRKQLVESMSSKVAERFNRRVSELRFTLKKSATSSKTSSKMTSSDGVVLVGHKSFLEQGVTNGSVIAIALLV